MQIWIDADACPGAVKQIVIRAAERTGITATFVANQAIQLPSLPCVKALQVSHGYDEADNEIVRRCEAGDLVITSDLPLAFDALQKSAQVISPRGEKFTADNIKARLNMRDFMETMRSSGVSTGGPPAYSQADKAKFANQFDRILARAK